MKDPLSIIPIDFDINNPPERPKEYDKKFKKRTDEVAEKIKKENNRRRAQYRDWLEAAKWYLANKALQQDRVSSNIMEQYGLLAKGFDKTVSLLSAFNKLKRIRRTKKRRH